MPGEPLAQIDALIALGFQSAADGVLTAPTDSTVSFAPVGAFLELRIVLSDGASVSAVLAKAALKVCRTGAKP